MTSAAQHVTLSDLREEVAASSNRVDVRACHQFRFFDVLLNNFSAPMPFLCLDPSIRHYSLTWTEPVFVHCFKDIHVSNVLSSAKVGFCHGCTTDRFLIRITAPVVAVAARDTAIRSNADFSCDGRSADRDSQRQSKRIFVGSLSTGSGRQCASTKQPEPSFPLGALCGGWDRGVLRTAIFSASVAMAMSGSTCPAPFCEAARTGTVWRHNSFVARAPLLAIIGRPPCYTVPFETRWKCDWSLFTSTVCDEGQDPQFVRCSLGASVWLRSLRTCDSFGHAAVSCSRKLKVQNCSLSS